MIKYENLINYILSSMFLYLKDSLKHFTVCFMCMFVTSQNYHTVYVSMVCMCVLDYIKFLLYF